MNYNISELNYENFIIGSGWPCYKNISIKEMTDRAYPTETTPRYDTKPGNSRIEMPQTGEPNSRDARLMKELYTQLNKILAPYVERVLNQYEYVNSPIYDEEGIDRETLAQLVSKVIDMADEELDETQEIMLEATQANMWSKKELLNSLIQALVLSEIFMVRRPRYRRARNNYRYNNGMYDGINPQ